MHMFQQLDEGLDILNFNCEQFNSQHIHSSQLLNQQFHMSHPYVESAWSTFGKVGNEYYMNDLLNLCFLINSNLIVNNH